MGTNDLEFGFGVPGEGDPGRESRNREGHSHRENQDAADGLSADFEGLLRAWRAPSSGEALRTSLRERFVSPIASASPAPAVEFSDQAKRSLGKTLQDWPAATPDPNFRDSVRGQFLAMAREADHSKADSTANQETGPSADQPVRGPRPSHAGSRRQQASQRRPVATESRPGPPVWVRLAPLYAAAAAILFWALTRDGGQASVEPPGPTNSVVASLWALPDGVPSGGLSLDGTTFEAPDSGQPMAQAFQAAMSDTTWVQAPADESLRLAYGRLFQVELAPGSRMDVSQLHAADDGKTLRLAMHEDSGRYAIQTGPDFKPGQYELFFVTPDTEVQVTGTVFAIDRYPQGTCVCCAEGSVSVACDGSHTANHAGHSHFVFPTKAGQSNGAVPADHMEPMQRLMEAPLPSGW